MSAVSAGVSAHGTLRTVIPLLRHPSSTAAPTKAAPCPCSLHTIALV